MSFQCMYCTATFTLKHNRNRHMKLRCKNKGQNINAGGQNINAEGQNINAGGQNINARGQNINGEGGNMFKTSPTYRTR